MGKCEKCGCIIVNNYGSGRFCSIKCARSFSTSKNRDAINKKISKKLMGHKPTGNFSKVPKHILLQGARKGGIATAKKFNEQVKYDLENISWSEFIKKYSIRTIKKVILQQQSNRCSHCGLSEWNGRKLVLQLHHKDGNNKNHARNNLEVLCMNCHGLTDNYSSKNRKSFRLKKGML